MAVGRRKHFASSTLPTVSGTLMTAGAAPADGSAAATVWIYLCNAGGASATAIIVGPAGVTTMNETMAAGARVGLGPIDMSGGETITGVSNTASAIHYHIVGVEARDT